MPPSPMVRDPERIYASLCVPGVHGGYPSLVYTVVYMVGIHHPGICLPTPPWVYPSSPTLPCRHHPCWLAARCAVSGRGAQSGRKGWVGREVRVNVDNPVRVGRAVCAELLRFPREINNNDRIENG